LDDRRRGDRREGRARADEETPSLLVEPAERRDPPDVEERRGLFAPPEVEEEIGPSGEDGGLGPEGGEAGGWVVATGTPEQVARNTRSHTGAFLKNILLRNAETRDL